MKKIFISVGMKGREADVIEAELNRARMIIRAMFYEPVEIIDNWGCLYPGEDNEEDSRCRLWYLGKAIQKIGECDYCYFVEGWENYTGCFAERDICRLYNIPIIDAPEIKNA